MMKKNWILKLGMLVMVLTLVTMPMVSSTYAKYVTTATGTASARAAKWGVTVNTDFQNAFGDAYAATTADTSVLYTDASATVKASAANTDVIAPGTKGSFVFGVSGNPEVSVGTDYTVTITRSNWSVVGSNDYDPIKYTITRTIIDNTVTATEYLKEVATLLWSTTSGDIITITATELKTVIDGLAKEYKPNATFSESYTVAWEWPFSPSSGNSGITSTGTSVETYYVSDGLGNFALATGAFVPGTVYYNRAGTGPYTYAKADTSLFLPAGTLTYDQADTYLGNVANATVSSAAKLAIVVTATATQIN